MLKELPDGSLLRIVSVARANIFYAKNGKRYRLAETRQEFADGRTRIRTLDTSVSEKLKVGEDPHVAIVRGIAEELNIKKLLDLESRGESSATEESPSYPGLRSEKHMHDFSANIPESEFDYKGYVERQKDKTTTFEWILEDFELANAKKNI